MISIFNISILFRHFMTNYLGDRLTAKRHPKLQIGACSLLYTQQKCFWKERKVMNTASRAVEDMDGAGQVLAYQCLLPLHLSQWWDTSRWARTQRRLIAFCCSIWESGTYNGARNPCLGNQTLFRLPWESSWSNMQVNVAPVMEKLKKG